MRMAEEVKFWLILLCMVTHFLSDPFASLVLTMFERASVW